MCCVHLCVCVACLLLLVVFLLVDECHCQTLWLNYACWHCVHHLLTMRTRISKSCFSVWEHYNNFFDLSNRHSNGDSYNPPFVRVLSLGVSLPLTWSQAPFPTHKFFNKGVGSTVLGQTPSTSNKSGVSTPFSANTSIKGLTTNANQLPHPPLSLPTLTALVCLQHLINFSLFFPLGFFFLPAAGCCSVIQALLLPTRKGFWGVLGRTIQLQLIHPTMPGGCLHRNHRRTK
ncbi:MAG: hypothetical protein CM15mV33_200 [uncultured marine virus]|nr:MAG: hypothetical protein CM15mV33_200 [uncultured marine virus]